MKSKYLLIGVAAALVAFASAYSSAVADDFDPQACKDRCMERVKDKEKCDFICDPKNHPKR